MNKICASCAAFERAHYAQNQSEGISMTRSHKRSQTKVLTFLQQKAYEQGRNVVLIPSFGAVAKETGQHRDTVAHAVQFLTAMGRLTVEPILGGAMWIDVAPEPQGDS